MSDLTDVFRRLVGLETEYALRFQPAFFLAPRPTQFELFRAILGVLRQRVPVVRARHLKEGAFLANGGAVWFETERVASGGGLIEGSTPECRGARQTLLYQRAQDRLLGEAAAAVSIDGGVRLLKNCRDSLGNIYGAQENYEAELASGWRLWAWRAGVAALLPLVLLTWTCLLLMILGIVIYLGVAGIVYLIARLFLSDPQRLAVRLFGRDLVEGRETGMSLPAWLEWPVLTGTRIFTAPTAVPLLLLAWWTAFVPIRRRLLAMLVSRTIFAGSGMLDDAGGFHVAEKAEAINCLIGLGGFVGDRPVFNFGHFFKAASIDSVLAPRDYFALFRSRQRLQIGLGDSNMADVAEFLRIGTTLLVLDAIEAGALADAPRLRHPIRALHAFSADPTLTATVETTDGRRLTAIELQRHYFHAAQQFLAAHPGSTPEAIEVLEWWDAVLDALEQSPALLVGTLDWITKKYLLDEAGQDASWPERKKIDLRYHELSPEGYFHVLGRTGVPRTLTDADEVDRAIRTAPPDTPATTRGQYIREFADGDEPVAASWKRVIIGRGRHAKTIRLDRYSSRE